MKAILSEVILVHDKNVKERANMQLLLKKIEENDGK